MKDRRQLLRREGLCSGNKQKLFDSVLRPQLRMNRVKSSMSSVLEKLKF